MPRTRHQVIVTDASDDVQSWMDALIDAARTGTADWPHAHPDIPAGELTLAQLCRGIERHFTVGGRPWSIVRHGFPRPDGGVPAGLRGPEDADAVRAGGGGGDSEPSRGSSYHNLLHNLLGDFH